MSSSFLIPVSFQTKWFIIFRNFLPPRGSVAVLFIFILFKNSFYFSVFFFLSLPLSLFWTEIYQHSWSLADRDSLYNSLAFCSLLTRACVWTVLMITNGWSSCCRESRAEESRCAMCVLPCLSAVDSGKRGHGAGCQLRTGQCVPGIDGRWTWARLCSLLVLLFSLPLEFMFLFTWSSGLRL